MKLTLVRRRWSQLSYTGLTAFPKLENQNSSALLNSSITMNIRKLTKDKTSMKFINKKKQPWLINPDQKFFIFWNLVAIMFIVLQAFVIPWLIIFPSDDDFKWVVAEITIQSFFAFDIAINFHTAYYKGGELITKKSKIAHKYIKFWFWLDLISVFPYSLVVDLIIQSDQSYYVNIAQSLRILKLIRLFNLVKIAKLKVILYQLDNYIQSSTILTAFTFMRIAFFILILAHWIACAWIMIAFVESNQSITWKSGFNINSNSTLYIRSLYWTVTTIITVGYGDQNAQNQQEQLLNIFIMLTASASFPYILGLISSLLSKQAEAESMRRKQMIGLNHYMRQKHLSKDLKMRARRYCEVVWERNLKNNIKEDEICNLMSDHIRDKIFEYSRGHLISECPIFSIFTYSFYTQICAVMKNSFFAPGDRIFNEGEAKGPIYFIVQGHVQIYHYRTQTVFQDLKAKDYFGQITFFTDFHRTASAMSLDFLETMSIKPNDMQSLLEKNPEAMEQYNDIRRLCSQKDFSHLQIYCYLCGNLGHVAINCKQMVIQMNFVQQTWITLRQEKSNRYVSNKNLPNFNRTQKYVKRNLWNVKNIKGCFRSNPYVQNPNLLQNIHIYRSLLNKNNTGSHLMDEKKAKINDLLHDDIESSNYEDFMSEGRPDYRFRFF